MRKTSLLIAMLFALIIGCSPAYADNISITKTVLDSTVNINDIVIFTINLTNINETNITGLELADNFNSTLLNYTSSTTTPTTDNSASGQLKWNITDLENGSEFIVQINFTALLAGTTDNIAELENGAGGAYATDSVQITISEPDLTTPYIENVTNSSITNQSALINWNTNELSNSTVKYGTTESLTTGTNKSSSQTTTHSRSIYNLISNTTYYYNVTSCDSTGNCNTSGPYSFTTLPNTNPPTINSVILSSYEFLNNSAINITVNVSKGTNNVVTVTSQGTPLVNQTPVDDPTSIWTVEKNLIEFNEGTNYVAVIATDSEGFQASANSTAYTTTDTPPRIISQYPPEGATLNSGSDVIFNFTTNKNVTGNFSLNNNSTKTFTSNNTIFTFTLNGTINASQLPYGVLANDNHFITIYVQDAYGNNNTKTITFSVDDTTKPNITSHSTTGTSSSSTSGTATITVNINEYSNCWIHTSSTINASSGGNMSSYTLMTRSPGKALTNQISYSSDSTIRRYVSCRDLVGNNMTGSYAISFSVSITEDEEEGGGGTGNDDDDEDTPVRAPRLQPSQPKKEPPKEEIETPAPKKIINYTKKREIQNLAGQDLKLNEKLQKAFGKILGKENLTKKEIAELLQISDDISKNTKLTRTLSSEKNITTMKITVKYTGTKTVNNFSIYERIPKEFSATASGIAIFAENAEIQIVEEDPEFLITYNQLNPENEISYSYSVKKSLEESIIERFTLEIYGDYGKEDKKDLKPGLNAWKIVAIIIWVQILVVGAFLYHYRKQNKNTKKNK